MHPVEYKFLFLKRTKWWCGLLQPLNKCKIFLQYPDTYVDILCNVLYLHNHSNISSILHIHCAVHVIIRIRRKAIADLTCVP